MTMKVVVHLQEERRRYTITFFPIYRISLIHALRVFNIFIERFAFLMSAMNIFNVLFGRIL